MAVSMTHTSSSSDRRPGRSLARSCLRNGLVGFGAGIFVFIAVHLMLALFPKGGGVHEFVEKAFGPVMEPCIRLVFALIRWDQIRNEDIFAGMVVIALCFSLGGFALAIGVTLLAHLIRRVVDAARQSTS